MGAASWVLVADLKSLFAEFDKLAPDRSRISDGTIGDAAHAATSSDHNPDETGNTPFKDVDTINEVHAIDVTATLNKPGWDMQRCVDIIRKRHMYGLDNRLQNIIYNRQIASRSWGWMWRPYTGVSAHIEHAHFSSRYGSGDTIANPENDTRPWGLLAADTSLPQKVGTLSDFTTDDLRKIARQGVVDVIAEMENGEIHPTDPQYKAGRQMASYLRNVLRLDQYVDEIVAKVVAQLRAPV